MSLLFYTLAMAAATAASLAVFVFVVSGAFTAAAVAAVLFLTAAKIARVAYRAEVARYNRGPQSPLRA